MADDPNSNAAYYEAQRTAAESAHRNEVAAIIQQGQEQYGSSQFDDISNTVATALGAGTANFMTAVRAFDNPTEIIRHLGENPDRLDRFAKLPAARQLVELAKIQGEMSPNGTFATAADPAWKKSAGGRRMSERDFASPLQDTLSDAAYDEIFFKKMDRRYGRTR